MHYKFKSAREDVKLLCQFEQISIDKSQRQNESTFPSVTPRKNKFELSFRQRLKKIIFLARDFFATFFTAVLVTPNTLMLVA